MKNGNTNISHVLLLFPPNWSACVNSPHLGLPLIAGSLLNSNYSVETLDLSTLYYNQFNNKPDPDILETACKKLDFHLLNKLYFGWQKPFEEIANKFKCDFGLVSGFTGKAISSYKLEDFFSIIENGTPFTEFFSYKLFDIINQKSPEYIGVSISSYNQFISGIELIKFLNKEFKSIKVILGGNYITRLKDTPELKLISKFVDCIILYQGEVAFLNYLMISKKKISKEGVLLGDRISLKEWSTPNFNGINIESYPGNLFLLPIVFTRGCYYNKCSFCTIPMGWSQDGFTGTNETSYILKQIEKLISKYGTRNFKIIDESFIPKRINDFLKFGIEFYWEAYVRVEVYWENLKNIDNAYQAGCRKLYFGLEQAPETNIKYLNKNNTGNIYEILENCKKVGIQVHVFTLYGYPGSTVSDAEKTAEFLLNNADLIDTADISGFRMERIVDNEFVRPIKRKSNLKLCYDFVKVNQNAIDSHEIEIIEQQIIDYVWENEPKLIHPLYRIGLTWN